MNSMQLGNQETAYQNARLRPATEDPAWKNLPPVRETSMLN